MSEILTVRTETTSSVIRKTPPMTATAATMSLLKYCLANGKSLEYEYKVAPAANTQAMIDSTSRMKPRTMASRPEISITTISTISSRVIGMVGCPLAAG